MAVSKRIRYEVLRRDEFTCRYCRSTDGELTIDHVKPVSLGGTDEPANLVACCRDCNAGKASSSPDADLVDDVAEDAIRWSKAMQTAIRERSVERDDEMERLGAFYDFWQEMTDKARLPGDWEASVKRFLKAGLSPEELEDAVITTAGRVSPWSKNHFRYFCGICWSNVRDIQDRAKRILEEESA